MSALVWVVSTATRSAIRSCRKSFGGRGKSGTENAGPRWPRRSILLLALAAVFLFLRKPAPAATGPQAIRSIAVLPLDNYSGDPSQDYFAEGMTDELTTDLATISQLRVISRSSTTQFAGAHRPPTPEIGKLLNVDAVVEGSVRRAGDKVRITAQLIDARADRHLWAKTFEGDSRDVLALQDQLASAIAGEINVQLTPSEKSRLTTARAVNPEAHDAYLKGRYFFNRPSDENLKKAITQFEQAIALDPNFAPAYSGLSDAYLWAAFNEGVVTAAEAKSKTKAAAEKALALDPGSAEAHTSLANYKSWYEHDWAGADKEFRQAISLNPNYAFAHDQWALSLGCEGRYDESITEGRRAEELDPLDPAIAVDNTLAFAGKGQFQEAKDEARRGAGVRPDILLSPNAIRLGRPPTGKRSCCHPGTGESRGDGGAAFRDRLPRLRLRRRGRSRTRDGDDRGAEEKVRARLRATLQSRDRPSRSRRS